MSKDQILTPCYWSFKIGAERLCQFGLLTAFNPCSIELVEDRSVKGIIISFHNSFKQIIGKEIAVKIIFIPNFSQICPIQVWKNCFIGTLVLLTSSVYQIEDKENTGRVSGCKQQTSCVSHKYTNCLYLKEHFGSILHPTVPF